MLKKGQSSNAPGKGRHTTHRRAEPGLHPFFASYKTQNALNTHMQVPESETTRRGQRGVLQDFTTDKCYFR